MKNRLVFDVKTEKEIGVKISSENYYKLLSEHKFTEIDTIGITQYWLPSANKDMSIRIRHTKHLNTNEENDLYEHTVKYRISDDSKLEINTDITKGQYDLIKLVNEKFIEENKTKTKKIRCYLWLYGNDGQRINDEYEVIADFYLDDAKTVRIEFEKRVANAKPFIVPEWLTEVKL